MSKRAEDQGSLTLTIHKPTTPDDIERLLQVGFEVEDRSWKGREGTSVLKSPIQHRYLRQQALLLAELGHLELVFLEFDGKPIAFEYGLSSKAAYFSPKVGYDEEYSHLSPGQLLRLKMMERFFADPARRNWDFLGPLVEATERWTTGAYTIERLLVATGGMSGELVLRAYRDWWPAVRRMRDGWRAKKTAARPESRAGEKSPVGSEKC
jgi:CelD/BcsL family acetyltransferase involved in cellulose biosynthesis